MGRDRMGRDRMGRDRMGRDPTSGAMPAEAPVGERPGGLRRGLALLVAGASFMEFLDGTVIAPAAPHIAADLGVRPVSVNVAITAYVLSLAVFIPLSGWLADRFGTRRVFMAAIAGFTLASVGCAAATSLPLLVAARVVQGAAGAMMVPVGRVVVLRTTAKADLVRAIAYLTWPALAAPVVAPALGGVLATYASWRWIFLVNVPLGVAALLLSRRLVPDGRGEEARGLDWPGFLLTAVGVAALVVGLEALGSTRPHLAVVVLGLAGGAGTLAVAVRHLQRADRPLLDLQALRIETFRAAAVGGSGFRAVMTAVPFLLALFFQLGLGWTAARAGLVVIALFVGNVGIKPLTTPLMRWLGIRSVVLVAVAGSALCLAGMVLLTSSTPLPLLAGLLVASGVFRSIGLTAYNTSAFADVEPARLSGANPLLSTLQELGAGLGVAVGALLVRVGGTVASGTGWGDGADVSFRVAFAFLAVLLAVPLVETLLLSRTAGDGVTGHVGGQGRPRRTAGR
jgi:EmrB/QacA subfamily drug resistance transporter